MGLKAGSAADQQQGQCILLNMPCLRNFLTIDSLNLLNHCWLSSEQSFSDRIEDA
jgi:hypothetical protein